MSLNGEAGAGYTDAHEGTRESAEDWRYWTATGKEF